MFVQTFVLSENILILLTIHDGSSLTNNRKSRGPNTVPCGIPLKTSNQLEK